MNEEIFKKAYKKLKSSVYFDKTQLILRNQIVMYEQDDQNSIEDKLETLYYDFTTDYPTLKDRILKSISYSAFPKKLSQKSTSGVIINALMSKTNVEKNQYFIDMCTEGHILGVVWLMMIGYKLDKLVYEKSYGNRIRKNLINELSENPTYSPYLFEPYFMQYESWRDTALDEAKKYLGQKNDVMILTMDLRRYFYSVDVTKKAFNQMFADAKLGLDNTDPDYDNLKNLNELMFEIVSKYSKLFEDEFERRNILPIGFLPSNVISNWCLRNLDKAIVDGWNPVFYGRYVDDILIVDKIEHNSKIYDSMRKEPEKVKVDSIMHYYTENCCKWYDKNNAASHNGLFIKCDENGNPLSDDNCSEKCEENCSAKCDKNCPAELDKKNAAKNSENNSKIFYRVNSSFNPTVSDDKSKLIVQNEKMKLFYFLEGETDALIDCFKNQISKNKSEFRHMPEDDAFYQSDLYNEIYSLVIGDGINKFREVEGCNLDKFGLSKFLGKHLRVAGMISGYDKSKFEQNIEKIFTPHVILEYYIFWERIIETFVINENFDAVFVFVSRIISAISSLNCKDEMEERATSRTTTTKESLYHFLLSALIRSHSLIWKQEALNSAEKIITTQEANTSWTKYLILNPHESPSDAIKRYCLWYCKSRMIDKSVIPISVDILLSKNPTNIFDEGINLTKFYNVLNKIDCLNKNNKTTDYFNYIYYPYIVGMNEISIATSIIGISLAEKTDNNESIVTDQTFLTSNNFCDFSKINYNLTTSQSSDTLKVESKFLNSKNIRTICVGNGKKSKFRIAVANAFLSNNNITELYNGKPQRSYKRYQALSKIVNQAINEHTDILVLPEAYVPFEWLAMLSKTCERNKLAIICGVEYLIVPNKKTVFNLTAVILPFEDNDYSGTNISFHLKNHYAPVEKTTAIPRGYTLMEGNEYELYKWNDFYFTVYCCYELASITDRALFQSYADAIIAIEWNKDVNYYSNILESLSRDVHCYCIQVNSADYGDSRITCPSPTVSKDLVRTKGGLNSTILVGEIDIDELRRFQLEGEMSQNSNRKFKTTPPNFDTKVVELKYCNKQLTFGDNE